MINVIHYHNVDNSEITTLYYVHIIGKCLHKTTCNHNMSTCKDYTIYLFMIFLYPIIIVNNKKKEKTIYTFSNYNFSKLLNFS